MSKQRKLRATYSLPIKHQQTLQIGLLTRRALMFALPAAAFFRGSRAMANVEGGDCNAKVPLPHVPWLVTFDETQHPVSDAGLPTIRPGQPLQGQWALYAWNCLPNLVHDRWIGTPDNSHLFSTLSIQFEHHDIFPAATAGNFKGTPDAATLGDFYSLNSGTQRIVDLLVKDQAGNLIPVPGVYVADIGGTTIGPISESRQLLLVPDNSFDVVFAKSAPADGTTFMWKVDTLTVAISGRITSTIPGAPFSPMTASGTIIFTDLSTSSPLLLQPTPYSIAISLGAIGAVGSAATSPLNFSWPWFDHTPFGGINGPTSRTVTFALTGTIADNFGNQRAVTPATRTYQIVVSNTKVQFVAASITAYELATGFGAAAAVAAGLSVIFGILGSAEGAGPLFKVLAGITGAGASALATLFAIYFAIGAGDQANAADPPTVDPNYKKLVFFDAAKAGTLPKVKGGEDLWRFTTACQIVTKIYAALTMTEGRILGAIASKELSHLIQQQRHLAKLPEITSSAMSDLQGSLDPAIKEFMALTSSGKHPLTPALMSKELDKWPHEIPARIWDGWLAAGASKKDIEIIRERLNNVELRHQVLDFAGNMKSLSEHLFAAAAGARHESQPFLTIKL